MNQISLLKFNFSVLFFLLASYSIAQTNWQLCCEGYNAGFKKGFSYPEMIYSNTVVPPPCGCSKIIGGNTYESGFAVGFEDGRIAKMAKTKRDNKVSQSSNQKSKFETNEYVPTIPFSDFTKRIDKLNTQNQITVNEINEYIKYRDSRQKILVRECDINYYVQEKTKISVAASQLFKSNNYSESQKINQYIDWINQFESDALIIDMLNNSRIYTEIYLAVETYKQSGQDIAFNKKLLWMNSPTDASTAYGFALFSFYRTIIQWQQDPSIYASLKYEKLNKTEFINLMNEFNNTLPKKNGCFAGNCQNGYGVYYEWGFDWQEISKFQKFPYKTVEGFFKNGLKNGEVTTTYRNIKTGLPASIQTAIFNDDNIVNILSSKIYEDGKLITIDSLDFYKTYLDKNRYYELNENRRSIWVKTSLFNKFKYYNFEIENSISYYPGNSELKQGFAYSLNNKPGNNDTLIYYYGGFGKFNSQVMFWEKHNIGTLITDDGNRDTRFWNNGDQIIDSLRIFENTSNKQLAAEYKLLYYSKECLSHDQTKYIFCYFVNNKKVYKYYFQDNQDMETNIPLKLFLKRFQPLLKHRSKYFQN